MFWLHIATATIFFTALLPYCPTALLPYCPTALLPYCPTALLPYCPTALLPYCPTALLPYCPTAASSSSACRAASRCAGVMWARTAVRAAISTATSSVKPMPARISGMASNGRTK
ncbi:hypothetical protein C969_00052 [Brucella canis CNGB 1172]|nr:hypothetical protein C969_00052 [Brucella canis CNGB 1172]